MLGPGWSGFLLCLCRHTSRLCRHSPCHSCKGDWLWAISQRPATGWDLLPVARCCAGISFCWCASVILSRMRAGPFSLWISLSFWPIALARFPKVHWGWCHASYTRWGMSGPCYTWLISLHSSSACKLASLWLVLRTINNVMRLVATLFMKVNQSWAIRSRINNNLIAGRFSPVYKHLPRTAASVLYAVGEDLRGWNVKL